VKRVKVGFKKMLYGNNSIYLHEFSIVHTKNRKNIVYLRNGALTCTGESLYTPIIRKSTQPNKRIAKFLAVRFMWRCVSSRFAFEFRFELE
jgi:hypothetical protein